MLLVRDQVRPAGAVERHLVDRVCPVDQRRDQPLAPTDGDQPLEPLREHGDVHTLADVVADLLRQVVTLEDEGQADLVVIARFEEALVEQDAVVDGEALDAGDEAFEGCFLPLQAGVAAVTQAVRASVQVGEVEGAPLDEIGPHRVGGGGWPGVVQVGQVVQVAIHLAG
jgi:hypothetical protein